MSIHSDFSDWIVEAYHWKNDNFYFLSVSRGGGGIDFINKLKLYFYSKIGHCFFIHNIAVIFVVAKSSMYQ